MRTLFVSREGVTPEKAEVLVDDDIADFISRRGFTLHLTRKGYVRVSIMLHHLALKRPAEGNVIDHINRNPADNRRDNLREVSLAQNAQNNKGKRISQTGLRGVVCMSSGWYGARARIDGQVYHSAGTYTSSREAHAWYLRKCLDMGSLLAHDATDIDMTVLAEFGARVGGRNRAEQLPRGVTRIKNRFRASLRREKELFFLGGGYTDAGHAAAIVAQARDIYQNGGIEKLREFAKTTYFRKSLLPQGK